MKNYMDKIMKVVTPMSLQLWKNGFVTLMLAVMAAIVTLLVNTHPAEAQPTKTTTCITNGCHVQATEPSANLAWGVKVTSPATSNNANPTSLTVDAGSSFELDVIANYVTWAATGNSGMSFVVSVPSGWAIGAGTTTGAPPTGWKAVWDQVAGWNWRTGTVINMSGNWANAPDGYDIDWTGSPWQGATTSVAEDRGNPPQANDLDTVADQMGTDVLISVPGGTTPGSYEVHITGIGHNSSKKAYLDQMITVTVQAGGGDTTKPTVTSFTATTPVNSNVNIPVTAFTATDNTAVTGYLITESATPPAAGAAGWTGTAPATYTAVAGDGTKTLYPWAKDAAGNVSLVYGTPASVVVDGTGPTDGTLSVTPGNTQNGLSWTVAGDAGVGLRTGTIYDVRFLAGATPPTCATGTLVYTGDNLTYSHTGLTNGQQYSYRVCAYDNLNNVSAGTTGSGTPSAGATAPVLAAPTATAIDITTATLGANVTSDGGAAITSRGTVWGTTAAPTGNAVAEGGTATGIFTQARTGLTAGTRIFFRGYAINAAGTGYSPDGSFYTEPATQASAVNFTAVGSNGLTVNWTRGSGNEVIVLMKQAAAVDSDPVDGTYTGYTANAAFTGGTQIGTGNYVIYKGSGTSVAVTGLTASTTYHVKVYEVSGAVDTAGVDQGANYQQTTPATGSQATTAAANSPPTVVGSLAQYQTDGTTPIAGGGNAASNAVVVEAQVNDVDGDLVIIEVDIDSDSNVDCASPAVSGSGTPQALCTALADGAYDWQVRAKDDQGNTSGWSVMAGSPDFNIVAGVDIGIDTTPPTESGLAATPGDSIIDLAWNVASDGTGSGLDPVNTYKVVRSTVAAPADCTGAGLYTGNINAYSDTTVTNGTTYYYRVCAYDNVGNVSTGQTTSATPGSACTENAPTVSIITTDKTIAVDGGFADYTIQVTNNDVGACVATSFDLVVVDSNGGAFYATTIATDPLNVVAGGSSQTTLRVSAKANQNGQANNTYFYTAAVGAHGQSANSNPVTTTVSVSGGGCVAAGDYLLSNGDRMTTSR